MTQKALDVAEAQKMKRKMSQAATGKMNQSTSYKTEATFGPQQVSNEKTNALVQSLQESGLGDLVENPQPNDQETPMDQDHLQEHKSSSETESEGEAEDWEKVMTRYLSHILTKGDAQRAVRLLKQMDSIDSFRMTDDSVLYFKKKKLGNVFLLMHGFFGSEKRDALLAKQIEQFRKVLKEHNISVRQRKPYAKKKKNASSSPPPPPPAVDENVLSQLKQ
jgi:hypothetical protein